MGQFDEYPNATWVEEIPTAPAQKPRLIKGTREDYEEQNKPKGPSFKFDMFGGLDLAKRVDHSALEIVRLQGGILYQHAEMVWPHVNYGKVAGDIIKINQKFPMETIGFDQNNVGEFAMELFSKTELPMEGVKTTMQKKIDIIHILKVLFEKNLLKIKRGSEIESEIFEQESRISDAGNELYDHPQGRHDDRFWALGYACYVALPHLVGMAPIRITMGRSPALEHQDVDQMIDAIMGGDTNQFSL